MGKDDELDLALRFLELEGWTADPKVSGKGYIKVKCGCGRHIGWLHKTPSNPNHYRQKAAHLVGLCSSQTGGVR